MKPSVAIVGAGAIGCWLADAFSVAGWRVSLVARGATLVALQSVGVRVRQHGVDRTSWPRAGSPADLGVHDHVILTVKAHLLPDLALSLQPLFGPSTVVVSATNGIPWWFFRHFGGVLANRTLRCVDPEQSQERTFARQPVLGAVVHASVRVLDPAHVEIMATDRLLLGVPQGLAGRLSENVLPSLTDALQRGGINALVSSEIHAEVWAKLWGNMNMNPLSALTRRSTGAMLADADVCALCERMMEEMQACAARLGLTVPMTAAERMTVTRRLGDFKTSMLADLEAGKPLELDPQLGAVVEIADLLGLPAPFMRSVLGLTRLIGP